MQTALVIAATEGDGGRMASIAPAFIHPVAGRPLVWHTITSLLAGEDPPERVVIVMPQTFAAVLADHLPPNVRIVDPGSPDLSEELARLPELVLVAEASACLESLAIGQLRRVGGPGWIGSEEDEVAAAIVSAEHARKVVEGSRLVLPEGGSAGRRHGSADGSFTIRTRADLARMQKRIRDRIVAGHMDGGVTFMLPESVVVDVDVRIGQDTVLYPGVVLEGQTTIGEETVIGPGCRVIDSWVGSGVELKGWNYIANTSVRNRAILEPYVRRGFD